MEVVGAKAVAATGEARAVGAAEPAEAVRAVGVVGEGAGMEAGELLMGFRAVEVEAAVRQGAAGPGREDRRMEA